MNQYDDIMNRLGGAKPVNERDPFVAAGEHSLIVWAIETFNDQKWGQSVRVIFEVEASTAHPVGARVVRTFNLFKPSAFPTQATDADQFASFVCTMQGVPDGQHGPACTAILKPIAAGGNAEAQPARGVRIYASGQAPKAGNNPQTGKPYSYVRVTWRNNPGNTNELIASTRAALDAKSPYRPTAAYVPQQPAPVQYAQPQGVPPGVQQYNGAPMQVPQYAAPQPAPAPVQGAPTGGFLSMIPPR